MRTTFVCLVLVGLLLFCASALASPPPNYSMTTEYRNADGTVFHIQRDYVRDGVMHRREHAGGVQLQLEAQVESEVQFDSGEEELTTEEVEVTETTEQLQPYIEPHTIIISRNDLGIGWTLHTEWGTYSEHNVDPMQFGWDVDITFPEHYAQMSEKIGETSLLGYGCDIYSLTVTVGTESSGQITYTNIVTVARGLNVVLRTELLIDGVLYQITEVAQFSLERPDESLFVIPAGYSKHEESSE
ncbi:MAG: hypothetical protein GXX08_03980 [Firmicutes bacterium]|nr:hypothetical protein [Bacillota bacterium]